MTDETQVPDRMNRYSPSSFARLGIITGILIGLATFNEKDISADLVGVLGTTFAGGILGQTIDYVKGYFNERLELEYQRNQIIQEQNKQNKLESQVCESMIKTLKGEQK